MIKKSPHKEGYRSLSLNALFIDVSPELAFSASESSIAWQPGHQQQAYGLVIRTFLTYNLTH